MSNAEPTTRSATSDQSTGPIPTNGIMTTKTAAALRRKAFTENLPDWATPVGLIVIATLIYFILARSFSSEIFSSALEALADDGTDPYLFGVVFQDILLPLTLLLVLTTRPIFQRYSIGETTTSERVQIAGALVVIELVYLVFIAYTEIDWVSFGLFVIAVTGLIGGWRWGLALGLMSFFVEGSLSLMFSALDDYYLIQDNNWFNLLGWFYLTDIPLMAKIWAGFVAGQVGLLINRFRLGLGVLLVLGFAFETIPSIFHFFVVDAGYAVDSILAGGVINAVAIIVIMLQVQNSRNLAQLRKTEVNQIALTQAELRALRAQINPHFLFNSLNTIRYFVRTDPDQARGLLLNLSEVFQVALKAGETVSLKDEIEFTKSYLALEQARLDERLEVTWFVQNDDLLQTEVPTLLLQPVVENAVVHGIAPDPEGGRLQIMIMGSGDDLVLQVIDDGMGMDEERLALVEDPASAPDGSIGTLNIQQRLKSLYKNRGLFKVDSAVGHGTTVEMRVPLKQHENSNN